MLIGFIVSELERSEERTNETVEEAASVRAMMITITSDKLRRRFIELNFL